MMKKLLLALGAIMTMSLCASAQSTTGSGEDETGDVQLQLISPAEPVQETAKEIKERERRLRELNDDMAYAKAANSIRRGYFVLVADNIQLGKMGYRRYDISNNSNFVLVQNEDGIVQYALNNGVAGANGLGGWTGSGTVRNKRVKFEDNGDVFVQYDLMGPGVNVHVSITLYHNSKRAVANISGGLNITMYGEILPYRDKKHR